MPVIYLSPAPAGRFRLSSLRGTQKAARRTGRPRSSTARIEHWRQNNILLLTPVGYDAVKKAKGIKYHIVNDHLGLLLTATVHPADIRTLDTRGRRRLGRRARVAIDASRWSSDRRHPKGLWSWRSASSSSARSPGSAAIGRLARDVQCIANRHSVGPPRHYQDHVTAAIPTFRSSDLVSRSR